MKLEAMIKHAVALQKGRGGNTEVRLDVGSNGRWEFEIGNPDPKGFLGEIIGEFWAVKRTAKKAVRAVIAQIEAAEPFDPSKRSGITGSRIKAAAIAASRIQAAEILYKESCDDPEEAVKRDSVNARILKAVPERLIELPKAIAMLEKVQFVNLNHLGTPNDGARFAKEVMICTLGGMVGDL